MAGSDEALSRYQVESWGGGYFTIDDGGFACVTPDSDGGPTVRIADVVAEVQRRGFRSPFLLRFPQILGHRVHRLHEAFDAAIREFDYPATYQGVYPIKVNQQQVVLEALAGQSGIHRYGLEAGSKGELVLALATELHPEALVVCNGYKDGDFLELALRGRHAGTRVVIIAETLHEVRDILTLAREIGVKPEIGVRARLGSQGTGAWVESGGNGAKFGLSTLEILEAIRLLREADALDSLRVLHTHIGSQVSDILAIKEAVKEAARLYCQMKKRAPDLEFLDLGGGLGVDYDGSGTASQWSRNYELEEYCRDCVYNVMTVCEQEEVACPKLVTESGRAVAAYHSMVAVRPIKVIGRQDGDPLVMGDNPCHQVLELRSSLDEMMADNWREHLNDARSAHEELFQGFKLGFVSMEDRAVGEALFIDTCRKALRILDAEDTSAEEITELEEIVAPTVVCNFSVFQSIPDTWGVRQVFPVMPLSRLTEEPAMLATLADITCDSDGRIDAFSSSDSGHPRRVLPLPPLDLDDPYLVGIFLVGAYQDTLGDFHNLFGCANEVTVTVGGPNEIHLSKREKATTVSEAVDLFGFTRQGLISSFEDRHGGDDRPEAQRYRDVFIRVLNSTTYLRL